MKQIPLLQGKALLIELPEGAKSPRIETNQSVIPYGQDLNWDINGGEKSYWMDETERVSLPPGKWHIIGMLDEVTESEAAELVRWDGPYKFFTVDTRVESLESAIECEGYSFTHPEFPDINDPIFYDEPYDGTGFYQELYSGAIEEYHKAQSRVLDRSRCLLLGRED